MTKNKFVGLLLSFTLVFTFTGYAGSATAASCVSEKSFSKVKNGMTVAQVKKIWGTNGVRDAYSKSGSYSAEVRSYKACSQFGAVAVSFSNGKVAAKSGLF